MINFLTRARKSELRWAVIDGAFTELELRDERGELTSEESTYLEQAIQRAAKALRVENHIYLQPLHRPCTSKASSSSTNHSARLAAMFPCPAESIAEELEFEMSGFAGDNELEIEAQN
jgi:hypothetical protein